jgi:hypothetical protein
MKNQTKAAVAILSLGIALASSHAMAAGTITGVTTDKANIVLGQSLNGDIKGILNPDQFKKGCALRMSLKYADNTVEIVNPFFSVNMFPVPGFYLKPTKSGKVKVIADGGQNSPMGWPACSGSAQIEINVTAPIVVSADPGTIKIKPGISTIPQGGEVSQLPPSALQLPTLTSIKQVQFTDHSGETWIEVAGSGNCTYTIDSAGLPPSTFSSSAAKPFPMKVKIANAPLGSHTWHAKGTGSCTGQASATFSVD